MLANFGQQVVDITSDVPARSLNACNNLDTRDGWRIRDWLYDAYLWYDL